MDAGQQSWLVGWFHGRCEMMKENGPPPHRFFSNSHANALCSGRCVARVVLCCVLFDQDVSDRVELPVYLNVTRKQLVTTGLIKGPSTVSSGTWYQRGTSIQLWRQV